MKVEIITVIYNEEMLLPIFLNHYRWADKIHVILDQDTNDRTRDFLHGNNIEIHNLVFPDMMDAEIKQKKIHELYGNLTCDWVFVVDCDEFIFPFDLKESCKDVLSRADGNYFRAFMWPVYRHRTDSDLNATDPVWEQRRHGDPEWGHGYNSAYIKPCIGKPSAKINWYLGCHSVLGGNNVKECTEFFQGAHWKMADPKLAVVRRMNGRNRQSKVNLACRYQLQDHHITEEAIRQECENHLDDEVLF